MSSTGSAQVSLADVSQVEQATKVEPRHSFLVRATHWMTVLCFVALLVTGCEIVISHPRFYLGETGTVNDTPLFSLHIPSSRSLVPTGYGYTMPDQNGWSRALHFQSAWLLVLVGLLYAIYGVVSGHFRKSLVPRKADLSLSAIAAVVKHHLRFERPSAEEARSYNVLQRLTYLVVIFGMFPLMVWTGVAMSPGFTSVFPWSVILLGGRQTARTLHFFLTIALVGFFFVHVAMVWLAGFWSRMRAMITGKQVERV